jgi:histidinol-phosphatase (PHP family)
MMRTGYHNHTTWSDGSATVSEMIDGARKAGLEEFGISDHFALAPNNLRIPWALAPESLDAYVAEVEQAMANTKDVAIRLGLEVDYFPETIERIQNRLRPFSFDYLIASVHFVDDFPIDMDAKSWEKLSQNARDGIWRCYWQRLRAAAESCFFDIIGHFDLPKKFEFYPSIDLTADAMAALDAVAAADMVIEINSAGWDRPVKEAYPSLSYLQEANRRRIPLIINTDAHAPGEVARHFERARRLAVAAGYSEVVRFKQRKRFPYPL